MKSTFYLMRMIVRFTALCLRFSINFGINLFLAELLSTHCFRYMFLFLKNGLNPHIWFGHLWHETTSFFYGEFGIN